MSGLLLPARDSGWLGAAAQPRIPPVVTGAKSDHWFRGLGTKGILWTEIIQLGNTVTDRHSLRKQRAKAECPVISASFGSLLISSITNLWRMHPPVALQLRGSYSQARQHHGCTDPAAPAAIPALRVFH